MNKNEKISNIELNIGESITKEKYIEIKGFIDHLNEMLTESEKTNNTILHKATEVYNKCTQYKQIIKNLTEKNKSLEDQVSQINNEKIELKEQIKKNEDNNNDIKNSIKKIREKLDVSRHNFIKSRNESYEIKKKLKESRKLVKSVPVECLDESCTYGGVDDLSNMKKYCELAEIYQKKKRVTRDYLTEFDQTITEMDKNDSIWKDILLIAKSIRDRYETPSLCKTTIFKMPETTTKQAALNKLSQSIDFQEEKTDIQVYSESKESISNNQILSTTSESNQLSDKDSSEV